MNVEDFGSLDQSEELQNEEEALAVVFEADELKWNNRNEIKDEIRFEIVLPGQSQVADFFLVFFSFEAQHKLGNNLNYKDTLKDKVHDCDCFDLDSSDFNIDILKHELRPSSDCREEQVHKARDQAAYRHNEVEHQVGASFVINRQYLGQRLLGQRYVI